MTVWTGVKISSTPAFDPQIAQPVASRYTVYAIPAPNVKKDQPDFPKSTGEDAHADSICDAILKVICKQRKYEFQNPLIAF